MRDVMERFLVLPISMGCITKSTTAAVESTQSTKHKTQKPQSKHHMTRIQDGKRSSRMKVMNSWRIVSRSTISRGIQRLILGTFQRFSQILKYKDVEEIEMEKELEIGYPTDVKHVTHIGYDGTMTTNPVKNWDNIDTPEIHSFPTISLKQFEHAMAAQSEETPSKNTT
ncbi:putative CRIB domain-containing protein [Helianthus annuus]|uniref:CRIB domain-containing protein n=1 Tax=Helianthus annuus TaxID=4232 RepID=A0A251TIN7_HELAN|nr:CRIB domain-containing protein RIC4 isoform X1 [Helianthus annuus]KAF5768483.1 putative CRIB domain-containing protein [Helianthus annuus]KAJ0467940.1 putative CRIB domain-containing protein [Helianthus annuus]KAJ0839786.1 putative CRIB domain-containing protein [Helianthus annuus]